MCIVHKETCGAAYVLSNTLHASNTNRWLEYKEVR